MIFNERLGAETLASLDSIRIGHKIEMLNNAAWKRQDRMLQHEQKSKTPQLSRTPSNTVSNPRKSGAALFMKTYSEKLRDPRWQKKRLEIMERDGFKCAYCHDASSTLNVHHAYYIKGREPWEYDQEMLITVCEECHELIEESKRAIMKTSVTDIMAFRVCAGIARSNCTAFVDSIHVWGVLKNKASADLLIEQIKSLTV